MGDLFERACEYATEAAPRFVIFSSYGNDSCALIQWAHELHLEGVAVVYSDTGWATADWAKRVEEKEAWARSLGFRTARTSSIGFADLTRKKKSFPKQLYQWCSGVLKIEPGRRWLEENDPEAKAICIIGVRRAEAKHGFDPRAKFPSFLPQSQGHGGRCMLAPFAEFGEEERNAFLTRAGIPVLPHRSRECRCINANEGDIARYDERDITAIERLEAEIGQPLYRPARCMGAKGIREVVKWANAPRGKYVPPEPTNAPAEPEAGEGRATCDSLWCEQ